MNYKNYAQVLYQSFKEEKDFGKFFENFISKLKQEDRIKILPRILREVEKIIKNETKKNQTKIYLKSQDDYQEWKEIIEKYRKEFDLSNFQIFEMKNIIGGFILKNSKKILDNSYKNHLLNLYKKIKS